MPDEPRRPAPPTPEKAGVQGGDRDVSTDQQPPSSGVPDPSGEGGMRGEERRESGGMGGDAF